MIGGWIDHPERVFARRQRAVANRESKRDVRNHLSATVGLSLGRHGHRTNQNQQCDHGMSLPLHINFSFCFPPCRPGGLFWLAAVEATGGLVSCVLRLTASPRLPLHSITRKARRKSLTVAKTSVVESAPRQGSGIKHSRSRGFAPQSTQFSDATEWRNPPKASHSYYLTGARVIRTRSIN